ADRGFRGDEPFAADDDRDEPEPPARGRRDDDRPPLASEPGDRLVAGHRPDLGEPGPYRAPAGQEELRGGADASLRDAPPATGFAQPGVAPPGTGPGKGAGPKPARCLPAGAAARPGAAAARLSAGRAATARAGTGRAAA